MLRIAVHDRQRAGRPVGDEVANTLGEGAGANGRRVGQQHAQVAVAEPAHLVRQARPAEQGAGQPVDRHRVAGVAPNPEQDQRELPPVAVRTGHSRRTTRFICSVLASKSKLV